MIFKTLVFIILIIIVLLIAFPYSGRWAKQQQQLFSKKAKTDILAKGPDWNSSWVYWLFRIGFVLSVEIIVGMVFVIIFGQF